ncbi:hypothetical protein J2S53_002033 [Actinopolyspora lacussalsi]|nr:hypothetical protein [Actinopolyspora lacussalsi]
MTWSSGSFRDAFVEVVRESGQWRDLEPDALLGRWDRFVADCDKGYPYDREDYFNDRTLRDSIEVALNTPELQEFSGMVVFRTRVEIIDARFRPLLIPDVFPKFDEGRWWARGLVRYARRKLVSELWESFGVEITEVG